MPAGGPGNCLKFLVEGDPKIAPAKIKLADTWTNEFAHAPRSAARVWRGRLPALALEDITCRFAAR